MTHYLGVDICGTFTDCIAVDNDARIFHAKTPSTHRSSPVEGVLTGLDLLAEEVGVSTREPCGGADRLGHGTTIGTSLIVERKGARVGLLATAGLGDALSMMWGNSRTAGIAPDQVYSARRQAGPAAHRGWESIRSTDSSAR